MRPAWKQPCKCAAHPWRPLQWDHVNQNQLKAFESGLRGSEAYCHTPDRKGPRQNSTIAWQDQQPVVQQLSQPGHRQRQHMAEKYQEETPRAVAAVHMGSVVQRQMPQSSLGSGHTSDRAVSRPGQQASCLKGSYKSQSAHRHPHSQLPQASCQHPSSVYATQRPSSASGLACSSPLQNTSVAGQRGADGRGNQCKQRLERSRTGRSSPGTSSPGRVMKDRSPQSGRDGMRKSVSPGRQSPSWAAVSSKHQIDRLDVDVAQHGHFNTHGQHASRVGHTGHTVQPGRSASASPTAMGNWIRWEADDNAHQVSNLQLLSIRASNFITVSSVLTKLVEPLA